MDLDLYLSENIDDILDNPEKYVSTSNENITSNKKVSINESANNTIEIKNNLKKTKIIESYDTEYDDIDEKEYMEYNHNFYDNSYEYYDIECIDDSEYNSDNENSDNYNLYEINYENGTENKNEDNCEDDILDELYEKMHNSIHSKTNVKELFENPTQSNYDEIYYENISNPNSNLVHERDRDPDLDAEMIENDDGYYFFNLMNIFMRYYNNKYDKTEHFFSNIGNNEKNTTSQMELFYDAVMEFKMMVEHMELDNDTAMKQLYTELEPEKISSMFEKWDKQIYMFEMDELKLFSPSLIVCLNYVYEKNILNSDWNIYNLRDN